MIAYSANPPSLHTSAYHEQVRAREAVRRPVPYRLRHCHECAAVRLHETRWAGNSAFTRIYHDDYQIRSQ